MVEVRIMSKSLQVKKLLLNEILSGKYAEGDRLPSDNDLIRALGVSRNTVREAMSYLITEGHVIRIQGKGSFVTQKRDEHSEQKSGVIRIICQDEHGNKSQNPFIGDILRGAFEAVEETPVSIKLSTFSRGEWFVSPEKLESICAENPLGVIFAGYTITSNIVKQFHQRGIHCCSIGAPEEGVDIPYVEVDHYSGFRCVMEYLLKQGHTRIALLDVKTHLASSDSRLEAYKDVLGEYLIEFDERLVQPFNYINIQSGKSSTEELVDLGATAFIVYGDYPALGVIQELTRLGKRVPEDISVVMYSGFDWVCQVVGMDITRVDQSRFELGARAVKLLLDSKSGHGQNEFLETEFVAGNTCAEMVLEGNDNQQEYEQDGRTAIAFD